MNKQFFNIQKTKKGYVITKTNNFIWNVVSTKYPLRTIKDVYNIRIGRKYGIIENTCYANNIRCRKYKHS